MSQELTTTPKPTLTERMTYAKALAQSGMLPAQYRGQPANLLYALEYADALGVSPITAVTSIYVVNGRPAASADLIASLVRRAGHRLRITGDDTHAVAQIVRADDPGFTYEARWDLDKAKRAGLLGKDGPWRQYPGAMLRARAITEVARAAATDALFGIIYTPDEIGGPAVVDDAVPVGGVVEDAVDVTDAEIIEDGDEPGDDTLTDRTRRELFALFAEHGITEEQQRKGLGKYMGRDGPVASRADATESAARQFIAWLRAQPDPNAEPDDEPHWGTATPDQQEEGQ